VTRAAGASTEKARSELSCPHRLANPLPPHLIKAHCPQVLCCRTLRSPAVIAEQQRAHRLAGPAPHAAGHVFYYSPSLFVRFCPTPIPQNSHSLLFRFSACLAIKQTTPLLVSFISPLSTLLTAQTWTPSMPWPCACSRTLDTAFVCLRSECLDHTAARDCRQLECFHSFVCLLLMIFHSALCLSLLHMPYKWDCPALQKIATQYH